MPTPTNANAHQHLAEILRRDGDLTHKRIKVQAWGELFGFKVGLMVSNPLNSKVLDIKGIGLRFRLRMQDNTYITNRFDRVLIAETEFATEGMEMDIYRARVVLKLLPQTWFRISSREQIWSAFCAKYSSSRNSILVSRTTCVRRITQCEELSMTMSAKRYFIGDGQFDGTKVVYFFWNIQVLCVFACICGLCPSVEWQCCTF